jgi:hypothetical protein
MLVDTLDGLVDQGVIGPDRRPLLELAAWSTVHGVADLLLNGPLRRAPVEVKEATIERALDLVIDGLAVR